MPSSSAHLLLASFVCWFLIVNSAFGAPSAVQRQRRQTFDFSSNTGDTDTDTNVDSQSFPTGSTGGNEGMAFNFENASTSWDPADRAPIVAADNVDPGIDDYGNDPTPSYPEYHYVDDHYDEYYDDYNGDQNDEGSDNCEQLCQMQCLFDTACYIPQCTNISCDYVYDDYDGPSPTNASSGSNGTTLRPISERVCEKFNGMRCIHGRCIDGVHCECDEGWTELACNIPCTKKCVHGICKVKPNVLVSGKPANEITEDDMFCNCEQKYYKDGCSEPVPNRVAMAEEEGRRTAIILGSCLIVAVIISIILPIVLWRKRVIFVMKVVYFFKMWEDNDGKTHDAYISAGTTGRSLKFVRNVLAPKLEQQGFKLFIPSRDQLCGAVISEDIITAIKQSRRTIMVVTPEYLQNDWSGFEVLNAQVEMIKLQQLIIPVILEDVSQETSNMRKSLRHILESVKCLKVPGYNSTSSDFRQNPSNKKKVDKFWRRLELTMPKKKRVSSDESSYYSQKDSSRQQNTHDNKYSKGEPDSKLSKVNGQTHDYDSIAVNLGDFPSKSYDAMAESRINPLSIYQISSPNNQDIDISKYEQCFNFKTAL